MLFFTELNKRLILSEHVSKDRNENDLEKFVKLIEPKNWTSFIPPFVCITAKNTVISWCGNFVERDSFRKVSDDSPETMRKLCLFTKFPHHEIRWNYGILRSINLLHYVGFALTWIIWTSELHAFVA